MFTERAVNLQDLISVLSERDIDFNDGVAYIMPESFEENIDLINEYSPDIRKDFQEQGIDSVVVKGANHRYLALRDADIILPLIFGIPFAVFANFITAWIQNNLSSDKTIRVKYVKEENGKYKELLIEGSSSEVNEIIESLKDL